MARFHSKQKTVTTAGTAVPLSAVDQWVSEFTVRPMLDNTGGIYLGDSGVSSSVIGALLAADALTFDGVHIYVG